jgi:phosphatidate cytidylyltransferase
MKKLLTRSLTGAIFVAVMVFSILWSSTVLFNLLLVVTCVGLYEYRTVLWENRIRLPMVLFYTVSLLVYFLVSSACTLSMMHHMVYSRLLLVSFCLLLLLPVVALFRTKEEEHVFRDLGYMFTAVIWIVVPFALMNRFPVIPGGAVTSFSAGQWLLLAFFLTIWANDTFAYCVGSLVGRHPFFERISPKKTWEGTLGGGVLALVLSGFYILFFPQIPFSLLQWLGFATVVVVCGTLGDLVESLFKRRMGVKDSGTLLPGHGGVLDRFDSALLAFPFVLLYVEIIL